MIVVAIIAIISAIAIPSLMKTRMQSNETAAVGSLKAMSTAQVTYRRDFPNYAEDFRDVFGDGIDDYQSDLNDDALNSAAISANISSVNARPIVLQADATAKSGYFFFSNHNYTGDDYFMSATPSSYNNSGRYTYFANSGATIYQVDYDGDSTDANPSVDADNIAANYDDSDDWKSDSPDGDEWTVAN